MANNRKRIDRKTLIINTFRYIYLTLIFFLIVHFITPNIYQSVRDDDGNSDWQIIVITPTHRRDSQIADMTTLSQTLSHIRQHIHWYVIEDGNVTSDTISRLLKRSQITHTYIAVDRDQHYPSGGWTQRNAALNLIRSDYNVNDNNRTSIVYFADDYNSYDIRLFTEYLPNVTTIGVWPVGLIGGVNDDVANDTLFELDVKYLANRGFATDMAGFAVNLNLILSESRAHFDKNCSPSGSFEKCFQLMLNVSVSDLQTFGQDLKDIFVWHKQPEKDSE